MQEYSRYKPHKQKMFTRLTDNNKKILTPSYLLEIDTTNPPLDRHVLQGAEKGLTLLNRSTSRVYGYYRLACGHFSFLHYGAVRKMQSAPKCNDCLIEKYKSVATNVGLTFLAQINPSSTDALYRCNTCSKDFIARPGNISLSSEAKYKCVHCMEIKYHQDAKNVGAKLLNTRKDNKSRLTYLMGCGHLKKMNPTSVNGFCEICFDLKLAKEAEEQGIEYLPNEKPTKADNKVYKLSCGCIKNLTPPRVRDGAFECKIHDKRFVDYSRSAFVYLIRFDIGDYNFLKVGFTFDTKGSLRRYQRYGVKESCITRLVELPFSNAERALEFEKKLHTKYQNCKLDKNIIKKFISNGYTECYPTSMMSDLLNEMRCYVTE